MNALTAFRAVFAGIADEFFAISISIGDIHIRTKNPWIEFLNVATVSFVHLVEEVALLGIEPR